MKTIVLGRLFESVGLCTSFQLIPMHRELGIDVFVTLYFLFFANSKNFRREELDLSCFPLKINGNQCKTNEIFVRTFPK